MQTIIMPQETLEIAQTMREYFSGMNDLEIAIELLKIGLANRKQSKGAEAK